MGAVHTETVDGVRQGLEPDLPTLVVNDRTLEPGGMSLFLKPTQWLARDPHQPRYAFRYYFHVGGGNLLLLTPWWW